MLIRVTEPGKPAFRLRKGEDGVSVFDPQRVEPPLTDAEIAEAFRFGSETVTRSQADIEAKGLLVIPIPGAGTLPARLREAHAEIRPRPGMSREQFKQALKELE